MKPIWREGLFIMPQHFQLFERYSEQLVDDRLAALTGYGWGVAELEIDQDELARGLLSLTRCTAVLPDGLLVQIGPDCAIASQSLMMSDTLTTPGQTTEVFLAVPSGATRGSTSYVGTERGARYRSARVKQPDAYGEAEDSEIECAQPNVQLLLGTDDRQNYVTLKLAELSVNESGTLIVSERYVPPTLQVASSATLMGGVSELVRLLSAKQQHLSEQHLGRKRAPVEFTESELSALNYLQALNRWLPQLMHFADAGRLHPEKLYLCLVALAGEIATFDAEIEPQGLARYNHNDLANSFLPLFEQIKRMIGAALVPNYQTIPLEQGRPGLFVGKVENQQILRSSQLVLVASGDLSEKALREDLPRYVKIGALDQIAEIVRAAITGVEAQVDLSPPAGVPVKAQNLYLRIKQQGPYWDEVLKSNTIAIYQPVEPKQVNLELLAVE